MAKVRKTQRKFMPPLDRVKADLAAGMRTKDLAEAYGVDRTTVKGFIRKHKLAQPKVASTYPPDEEIISALQARETVASMAKRFGVTQVALWSRIYDRRLKAFVEPPPPRPIVLTGLQPSPIKVVVTALDGSKISVPRIPTIHGQYEGAHA